MAKHAAVQFGTHLRMRRRCTIFAFYLPVGADAYIGPLGTDEFAADFRKNGAYCAGRCWHRPLQTAVQNCNRPSIPEMSRTEIDAVYRQLCVVHLSEAKAIGKIAILRPKRAFRPRSGQKIARVSAQYGASPSASFCLLFLAQQKKQAVGDTVAVLLHARQFGANGQKRRQMAAQKVSRPNGRL